MVYAKSLELMKLDIAMAGDIVAYARFFGKLMQFAVSAAITSYDTGSTRPGVLNEMILSKHASHK